MKKNKKYVNVTNFKWAECQTEKLKTLTFYYRKHLGDGKYISETQT